MISGRDTTGISGSFLLARWVHDRARRAVSCDHLKADHRQCDRIEIAKCTSSDDVFKTTPHVEM
jgi:hypothetical protein